MIKLILLGLGNDGQKFLSTRHNFGQAWLDYIVKSHQLTWEEKPLAFIANLETTAYQLILIKTKGYINQSGKILKQFLANSPWSDWPIMLAMDNVDLAFGKTKLVERIQKNGHKGGIDLVNNFLTDQFLTLYLGIGKKADLHNWVLSSFLQEESTFLQTKLFPQLTSQLFKHWKLWNQPANLKKIFFQNPSLSSDKNFAHLAVIGGQWGDEGKGKIVDYFSTQAYQVIARFSGGDNAGHTIWIGEKRHQFSILPVTIFQPDKISLLGRNCLINLSQLVKELTVLKKNFSTLNLKISGQAHLIMPYHLLLDQLQEEKLGKDKIGTTKRGIGPCWEDKVARKGIQLDDLFHSDYFEKRLFQIVEEKNFLLKQNHLKVDFQTIKEETYQLFQQIKIYVSDVFQYCQTIKDEKKILFEGAQGTLLDINFGAFPFVTSSGTVSAHVGTCFGNLLAKTKILGVFKAYLSRVGRGIFPTEADTPLAVQNHLITNGQEYGVVTKRKRRVGWFDAVLARYACQVNGFHEIALTLLDVLSGLEKIKICTAYHYQDKIYHTWTPSLQYLKAIKAQYLVLDGWKEKITFTTNYFQLPLNAKKYIATLEKLFQLPITIISVGKKRKETILTTQQVK